MEVRVIAAGTDLAFLDQLESRLTVCGYPVGKVGSIPDLLRQLFHYEPSLVIVVNDRPSPAWDAKEACRRVHEVSHASVMAIAYEREVVDMLRAGADDSVAWPIE